MGSYFGLQLCLQDPLGVSLLLNSTKPLKNTWYILCYISKCFVWVVQWSKNCRSLGNEVAKIIMEMSSGCCTEVEVCGNILNPFFYMYHMVRVLWNCERQLLFSSFHSFIEFIDSEKSNHDSSLKAKDQPVLGLVVLVLSCGFATPD